MYLKPYLTLDFFKYPMLSYFKKKFIYRMATFFIFSDSKTSFLDKRLILENAFSKTFLYLIFTTNMIETWNVLNVPVTFTTASFIYWNPPPPPAFSRSYLKRKIRRGRKKWVK